MYMELFPRQLDLALQISSRPSSASSASSPPALPTAWRRPSDASDSGSMDQFRHLGFWRATDSAAAKDTPSARTATLPPSDHHLLSLAATNGAAASNLTASTSGSAASSTSIPYNTTAAGYNQQQRANSHGYYSNHYHLMNALLKPIRGVPIYHHHHHQHPFQLQQQQHMVTASQSNRGGGRFFSSRSRFPPGRRSARAPRMRWTTTLHARFVHAVDLLGGHERATPKSVLELMDVKDLTLAHVKSHLQMYRTIKNTDKPAVSSGQNNGLENGSAGEIYDDNLSLPETHSTRRTDQSLAQNNANYHISNSYSTGGLWSNSSSRAGWLDFGSPNESNTETGGGQYLEELAPSKSFEMSEMNVSCISETSSPPAGQPNLEFTLGMRPQ